MQRFGFLGILGLDAWVHPGKGIWVLAWGRSPLVQRYSSPQVVSPPELPSCEKRAVMETGRWLMPSTWLGLR